MINKIRTVAVFLVLIATSFALVGSLKVTAQVRCDIDGDGKLSTQEAIKCGANDAAGVPSTADPGGTIDNTVANIINLLSVVIGIVAVIMIMIGGFKYITSAGNQESVKTAKSAIIYALIGLIIVALAQVIVRFVLNKTTT
ncbi:hypothetical protein HYW36_01815 [Candidatus Saccharibacteria bacterium]|nr:hypothetical protein [Candidatus Saccharibacteria bacterium]